MDWSKLEQLQGIRTTICFVIVMTLMSVGLFTKIIPPDKYLTSVEWLFGLYVGAKVLYKGTEVAKAKIDAKSQPVDQ